MKNSIFPFWEPMFLFSTTFQNLLIVALRSTPSHMECNQTRLSYHLSTYPFSALLTHLSFILGFSGGSDGKESACNGGNPGSIPGLGGFPGEGNGNPLQYSCLENSHGKRSPFPWNFKESDTAERLSLALA